jgi:hypothetical protein
MLTKKDRLAILAEAYDLGLRGHGGECGAAAMAMNEVLFGGKGKYVAALNMKILRDGFVVGHIGVLHDGIIWDVDGTFEDDEGFEDFLEWGMVGPEDYGLTDDEAQDAKILYPTKGEMLASLPPGQKEKVRRYASILRAAAEHLGYDL